MRVFALSDIHVDFFDNMARIEMLASTAYPDDALILAGDVSHNLRLLRKTLERLRAAFGHVFFVPGNHDLWIHDEEHGDSIEKFYVISELCARLDVHMRPQSIGRGRERVRIVPLLSWYTRPEQGVDSLFRPKAGEDPSLSMWADNHFIKWPDLRGATPAQLFAQLNVDSITRSAGEPTLTFSHFLPRVDVLCGSAQPPASTAESEIERQFNFSRVAGSTLIERQIRDIGSILHVYGHQHRNAFLRYDGVWYVSNCLGYPRERTGGALHSSSSILKVVWPLRGSDASSRPTASGE